MPFQALVKQLRELGLFPGSRVWSYLAWLLHIFDSANSAGNVRQSIFIWLNLEMTVQYRRTAQYLGKVVIPTKMTCPIRILRFTMIGFRFKFWTRDVGLYWAIKIFFTCLQSIFNLSTLATIDNVYKIVSVAVLCRRDFVSDLGVPSSALAGIV